MSKALNDQMIKTRNITRFHYYSYPNQEIYPYTSENT